MLYKQKSVAAGTLYYGCLVWDAGYYAPDKWVKVLSVKPDTCEGYVKIDVGHCLIVKHAREGVAAKVPDWDAMMGEAIEKQRTEERRLRQELNEAIERDEDPDLIKRLEAKLELASYYGD